MKQLVIFMALNIVALCSCQKATLDPPDGYESVLLIQGGVAGCGLLFQKSDNAFLEPSNLIDFDLDLIVGKEYWIKYNTSPNQGSVCMMGEVIFLTDLKSPFKN